MARREATLPDLVVATHNIMNGQRTAALVSHYRELVARRGLALLCLQEDRPRDGHLPSADIAAALGPGFAALPCESGSGLTVVYDRERLRVAPRPALELPRLPRLTWLERRYIMGGVPEQRYAQICEVTRGGAPPFVLANLHLDTAGDNRHRGRQLEVVARALGAARRVVCGDTNLFAPTSAGQLRALRRAIAPLARMGVVDPETRPTHFFARQQEPSLAHRLAARLARGGLEMPGRYDILATDLPVATRGQVHTPASDHDLVWVSLAP